MNKLTKRVNTDTFETYSSVLRACSCGGCDCMPSCSNDGETNGSQYYAADRSSVSTGYATTYTAAVGG